MKALIDEVSKILDKYEKTGQERRLSGAYMVSGHNLGKDMLSAVYHAKQVINGFHFSDDYQKDCLTLSRLIEDSREAFEKFEVDPECFGTGTLRSIALEIAELAN